MFTVMRTRIGEPDSHGLKSAGLVLLDRGAKGDTNMAQSEASIGWRLFAYNWIAVAVLAIAAAGRIGAWLTREAVAAPVEPAWDGASVPPSIRTVRPD
jgi:hypothetical protein